MPDMTLEAYLQDKGVTPGTPHFQSKGKTPITPPPPSLPEPPSTAPLATIDAKTLRQKVFQPLVEPVSGMICEGLTLLCGASKIGKSWFVLQMCCAVAEGKTFLGRSTMQGSVLYLALEDSQRRLQSRLAKIGEMPSEALRFVTQCQTLDTGLLEQLNVWIHSADKPRMIVIDTLQKIRGNNISSRANAYAVDYDTIVRLKNLADSAHIAIVLVHHLNKMQNVEDPYEKISGSTGLMGAADTTILIFRKRGEQDASVNFTGRDVWESDFTLRLTDGRWSPVSGEELKREKYERSPIPRTCRKLLEQAFDGVVKVASADFIAASIEFTGESAALTARALNDALESLAPLLRKYDGILVATGKRVNSQRGLHISKLKQVSS